MEVKDVTFDLHGAIAHVDAMVRKGMEDRGLAFVTNGVESLPRYVRSDVSKLRQILLNLLSNAAKFMPGMDGVEATRRIRQLPEGKNVPIVMLSASVFDEEREAVLQTGGNQFIAKPFQVADIWNALEQHLGVVLVSDAGPAPSKREGPTLTRQQVAALGEQAVTAVREAIALGYVQRIPALLAGVGTEHAVTVAALSRLAEDLELEKLNQLL